MVNFIKNIYFINLTRAFFILIFILLKKIENELNKPK